MSDERLMVMITGPQWVTEGFFEAHYEGAIRKAADAGCWFMVGAAEGVDAFAQELLAELCPERVIVCNKGTKDGRKSPLMCLRNGFASYPERDKHMANECTRAICTLPQYGGGTSGALYAILRAQFGSEAEEICSFIRKASEPWDEKVLKETIIPSLEKKYPSKTVSAAPVDAVSSHATDTPVVAGGVSMVKTYGGLPQSDTLLVQRAVTETRTKEQQRLDEVFERIVYLKPTVYQTPSE